jgi:hypothetical protein
MIPRGGYGVKTMASNSSELMENITNVRSIYGYGTTVANAIPSRGEGEQNRDAKNR